MKTIVLVSICLLCSIGCSQFDTLFFSRNIEMRDGNYLSADLYSLDTFSTKPVILIQTPYNKEVFRMYSFFMDTGDTSRVFDIVNYNIVVVDWRGYYASTDASVEGYNRGLDGYDCVEWIASQRWSDGMIGTYGGSALGDIQFRTAKEHPPHLVCAAPSIKDLRVDYSNYYYGGVLREEQMNFHESHGFIDRSIILEHQYCCDVAWDYIYDQSGYYDEIGVPLLIITGWFDYFTDEIIEDFDLFTMNSHESIRDKHKLVIGPWSHTKIGKLRQGDFDFPETENYDQFFTKMFFDYYLRMIENGYDEFARCYFYVINDDEWLVSDNWESMNDGWDSLFICGGNILSEYCDSEGSDYDSIIYDPHFPTPSYAANRHTTPGDIAHIGPCDMRDSIESRDDVLIYTSEGFDEDLTIMGNIIVRLFVSSNRLDTDICVNLSDVYPDGRSIVLNRGIRRMRFRDGYDEGILMTPGEIYEVDIEISSLAYTFEENHAMRIVLSGAAYPQFAINLNNGGEMYTEGDSLIAVNKIHHSLDHHSMILFEKKEEEKISEYITPKPVVNVFNCYPNPFNGQINIVLNDDMECSSVRNSFSIYDIKGNIVEEGIVCGRFEPDNDIESGIYFVVSDDDDVTHCSKIIYIK